MRSEPRAAAVLWAAVAMLPPELYDVVAGQLAREARTSAAVDRARASGALYQCPVCGTEMWRDNMCFGCLRAQPGEGD